MAAHVVSNSLSISLMGFARLYDFAQQEATIYIREAL